MTSWFNGDRLVTGKGKQTGFTSLTSIHNHLSQN